MGRRNLHSREALKELILQSSYEIICEEGFKEVTARKIASRIGYTAGTLYHIFESLDDILLHLKSRALDKFEQAFKDFNTKNAFSIESFFDFYISYCSQHHNDWLLLCEKHLEKDDLPSWYQDKLNNLFKIVVINIAEFTGADFNTASKLTRLMWSSVQGLCFLSLQGKLSLIAENDAASLKNEFVKIFKLYVSNFIAQPELA